MSFPAGLVKSELFLCLLAQEQPLMEAQLERRIPEDFLQQKYPRLDMLWGGGSIWSSEAFPAQIPGEIILRLVTTLSYGLGKEKNIGREWMKLGHH